MSGDAPVASDPVVARAAVDLRVDGIAFRIGDAELLRDVTLSLRAGTITGLLGPNGSGKSTLLRVVVGALRAAAGSVTAVEDGAPLDLSALGRRERARRLALVEQDAHAEVPLRVRDVVALGRLPHERHVFGGADATGDAVVADAMARAGIQALAERSFDTLSGGERQRVQLARALAQQPRVLLLDEPTNHLDLAAQLDVVRLLREVAATGVTVLVALHDLAQAAAVCDQVVVLERGSAVAAGDPAEVLSPALIASTWGVRGEWLRGEHGPALVVSPL